MYVLVVQPGDGWPSLTLTLSSQKANSDPNTQPFHRPVTFDHLCFSNLLRVFLFSLILLLSPVFSFGYLPLSFILLAFTLPDSGPLLTSQGLTITWESVKSWGSNGTCHLFSWTKIHTHTHTQRGTCTHTPLWHFSSPLPFTCLSFALCVTEIWGWCYFSQLSGCDGSRY